MSEQDQRKIIDADTKAHELMTAIKIARSRVPAFFERMLGRIATHEYALQNYARGDTGEAVLQETSMLSPTAGVINAAFDARPQRGSVVVSALKALRRRFNTELSTGTFSNARMATWLALRLRAEYDAQTRIGIVGGLADPSAAAREELSKLFRMRIRFVLAHTLNYPDEMSVSAWSETFLRCATCEEERVQEFVARFGEQPRSFLYYFFCHGN